MTESSRITARAAQDAVIAQRDQTRLLADSARSARQGARRDAQITGAAHLAGSFIAANVDARSRERIAAAEALERRMLIQAEIAREAQEKLEREQEQLAFLTFRERILDEAPGGQIDEPGVQRAYLEHRERERQALEHRLGMARQRFWAAVDHSRSEVQAERAAHDRQRLALDAIRGTTVSPWWWSVAAPLFLLTLFILPSSGLVGVFVGVSAGCASGWWANRRWQQAHPNAVPLLFDKITRGSTGVAAALAAVGLACWATVGSGFQDGGVAFLGHVIGGVLGISAGVGGLVALRLFRTMKVENDLLHEWRRVLDARWSQLATIEFDEEAAIKADRSSV